MKLHSSVATWSQSLLPCLKICFTSQTSDIKQCVFGEYIKTYVAAGVGILQEEELGTLIMTLVL